MSNPRSPAPPRSGSHFVLGLVVGLAVALLLAAVIFAPIALSHRNAGSLETAYGNAVVSSLARYNARSVGANPTTANAQSLEQGRQSFTGACGQCHGTGSQPNGIFGPASFPPATDLASASTASLSDGQIFSIIKDGLGFTAMPAFSSQFSDTQIWNMVNYIRAMQNGTQPDLQVPTPTADQLTAAKLPAGGNAQQGAAAYAAFGCAACHEPSGSLSINPANDSVADAVRNGKQGMPCYATSLLTDQQLLDIRAYIATFPPEGFLGGPQDRPGGPGGQGGPPSGGGQGGPPPGGGSAPASACSTASGGTGAAGPGGSSSPQPAVRPQSSPSIAPGS